jgi:hypothetical protein
VDSTGNVYVADTYNHTIRKVTPAGVVTTLAGRPTSFGSTDGNGSAARFRFPTALTMDSAGNAYVADSQNFTIRKVTPAGGVSTLVGLAGVNATVLGPLSARIAKPQGVAVDPSLNAGLLISVPDSAILRASNSLAVSPTPTTVSAPGGQQQFVVTAGIEPFTWTLSENNSGGSVTALGLYTAGSSYPAVDTVQVIDAIGTKGVAQVTVVAHPQISGVTSVVAGGQLTLTVEDGVGPFTWALTTNDSGGSLTETPPNTALYTAGAISGMDVVMVTDASGVSTSAAITVTPRPRVTSRGHLMLIMGCGNFYWDQRNGQIPISIDFTISSPQVGNVDGLVLSCCGQLTDHSVDVSGNSVKVFADYYGVYQRNSCGGCSLDLSTLTDGQGFALDPTDPNRILESILTDNCGSLRAPDAPNSH